MGVEFRVIALSLLIVLASLLLKSVIADIVFAWLRQWTAKTPAKWDDDLIDAIHNPVVSMVMVIGLYAATIVLPLSETVDHNIYLIFKSIITVLVCWGITKSIGVGAQVLADYSKEKKLAIGTFVPLFKQILVVILWILAVIMILETVGYSVSSIIAALGIGGAALAFASQSTIANLYGSIAIALDRPFKVGDVVKIKDTEGSVEAIGLRSTQIRTFTKTLVSIPNNTMATESIDNYSEMTGRRIVATLGLTYATTQTQIEAIIADLKAMLAAKNTELMEDPQLVHLVALADSSINIEMVCFTQSPDIKQFLATRQAVLMAAMKIVEKHGSSFAYPTQTVYTIPARV